MSTIKVDTIATRTGSGNITLSNNVASLTSAGAISGTNLTASGTLGVTGNTTMGGTAAITGNTTVGGTLGVTGATSLSNNLSLVKNQAAHTNIDVFNNSGSASAKGQIRVGYDAANCLEIFRVGNNANILLNATQNGAIIFQGAGGERIRLTGDGLTFNGDTAAANALDDYEEGTFTPTMSTAGSYGAQLGFYTKVGRIVHCQITLQWVNSGTSTGTLGGLPFTVFGQNYVTIVSREYYSSGETWNANLAIGSTSSYGFTFSNNQSTISNGQTYGLGLTFVYRVS